MTRSLPLLRMAGCLFDVNIDEFPTIAFWHISNFVQILEKWRVCLQSLEEK